MNFASGSLSPTLIAIAASPSDPWADNAAG
jgi:hypothetical protein